MAEDLGEKSEDATPRKLQQSREKGQVARSADLGAAAMLAVATGAIALCGWWMLERGGELVRAALDLGMIDDPVHTDSIGRFSATVGMLAAKTAAPLLLILLIAAVASQLIQIGPLFAPSAIAPSFSKLNPLSGFTRIFGVRGVVKGGIDLAKVSVVMLVTGVVLWSNANEIALLPTLTAGAAVLSIARLVLILALWLLAILLVVGIIDYTFQRQRHAKDLRMTKQEVKEELKETQGDPQTRQRRARIMQQIMRQHIGAAVPEADLIVTNPEHFAIAIKYDEMAMDAPKVVAKGADLLAFQIRKIATAHDIPIVERPPLARGLYRAVEVGQSIPPDFYAAVAEVLAYVYRLKGRVA